jgi:hypothetical protein
MRIARTVLLALVMAGCVGNVDSSTWDRTYAKPGMMPEQLQNDGLDCLPLSAKLFNRWVSGFTPADHAACMKQKGYTVNTTQ